MLGSRVQIITMTCFFPNKTPQVIVVCHIPAVSLNCYFFCSNCVVNYWSWCSATMIHSSNAIWTRELYYKISPVWSVQDFLNPGQCPYWWIGCRRPDNKGIVAVASSPPFTQPPPNISLGPIKDYFVVHLVSVGPTLTALRFKLWVFTVTSCTIH